MAELVRKKKPKTRKPSHKAPTQLFVEYDNERKESRIEYEVVEGSNQNATVLLDESHTDAIGNESSALQESKEDSLAENDPSNQIMVTSEQESNETATSGESSFLENGAYSSLVKDLKHNVANEPTAPPAPDEILLQSPSLLKQVCSITPTEMTPYSKTESGPSLVEFIEGFEISSRIGKISFDAEIRQVENEQIASLEILQKEWLDGRIPEKDPLFDLLAEYTNLRCKGREMVATLKKLEKDLEETQAKIWTSWPVDIEETSKCADNVKCAIKHSYTLARIDKAMLSNFQRSIARAQQFVVNDFWPNSGKIRLIRYKIENFLWTIQELVRAAENAPKSFQDDAERRLCSALDVLFYFSQLPSDQTLIEEIMKWLSLLTGLVSKMESWRLRLHLVWQIIRCISKVATSLIPFVEVPYDQFDHACAVLWLIFQPMKGLNVPKNLVSEVWVMVDEDVCDDNGLPQESVVNSLFLRVPLKEIIKQCLGNINNEAAFLKTIEKFSHLVEILEIGLRTYGASSDHLQLSRRIAKNIRTIMELATEASESFPIHSLSRLKANENLTMQCVKVLLSTPSGWMFLSGPIFNSLSIPNRWKLYGDMVGVQDNKSSLPSDLSRKIAPLSADEQVYLMLAVSSLAESGDHELKRLVLLQLFYAGFVSFFTRDAAYKESKEHIALLISKDVMLLSELLQVYDKLFKTNEIYLDSNQIKLWQTLPVESWVPTREDIVLLTTWLTANEEETPNNQLAQLILKMLNYNVVNLEMQRSIARAVVCASTMWMKGELPFKLLCKLRLHIVDRNSCDLSEVMSLSKDAELGLWVNGGSRPAIYLALHTTDVGHSVPVIFRDGFHLVRTLFDERCPEPAFASLDCMTTMFWTCPESLVSCPDFSSLLGKILTADETYSYLKMAKKIVVGEEIGPVLSKFVAMLNSQFRRCELDALPAVVKMWTVVLTSLPAWEETRGIVYLLDVVCRHTFGHPAAWLQVLSILEAALPPTPPPKPTSPLSIFRMGSTPKIPSILPNQCDGNAPWFAYAAICVEFEVYEKRTSLWGELLRELNQDRSKKTNVDTALKKVCNSLKLPVRTSSQLAIYRWAGQALAMDLTHHLNILVWYKFFTLFFARVPGVVDRGSPGGCFFDGLINGALKKQMKARLNSLVFGQPYLAKTYQTLELWLEETSLLGPRLMVASLPANYNPPLLAAVLSEEEHTGIALVPFSLVREKNESDATAWTTLLGRVTKARSFPRVSCQTLDHSERIDNLLLLFGDPPDVHELPYLSCELPSLEDCISLLLNFLANYDRSLKKMAKLISSVLRHCGQMYFSKAEEKTLSVRCNGVERTNGQGKLPCSSPAVIILKYTSWSPAPDIQQLFLEEMAQLTDVFESRNVDHKEWEAMEYLMHLSSFQCRTEQRQHDIFPDLISMRCEAESCSVISSEIDSWMLSAHVKPSPYLVYKVLTKRLQCDFLFTLFCPGEIRNVSDWFSLYKKVLLLDEKIRPKMLLRFDVAQWLSLNPPSDLSLAMVREIFTLLKDCKANGWISTETSLHQFHLPCLLMHEFPKYFGEILLELTAAGGALSESTWFTVIRCLNAPRAIPNAFSDAKEILSLADSFAEEQNLLTLENLKSTISLLGNSWKHQKQNESLNAKFSPSIRPILALVAMITKAIVKSAQPDEIWCVIEEQMSLWLAPLKGNNGIIMPFVEEYSSAILPAEIFVEILRQFAEGKVDYVLANVLQWFSRSYLFDGVDVLVSQIVHSQLSKLPWENMTPTLSDIEVFLLGANFNASSRLFLGNLFLSIDWEKAVQQSLLTYGSEIISRFHACLFSLLVKILSDPHFSRNEAVIKLLDKSLNFAWHFLDVSGYAAVMQWFPAVADCNTVLEDIKAKGTDRDAKIWRLIKFSSGFVPELTVDHPCGAGKRLLYIQAVVKCFATAANKRQKSPAIIKAGSVALLNEVENVLATCVAEELRVFEAVSLVRHILQLLTEPEIAPNVEAGIIQWISMGKGPIITTALLQAAGTAVDSPVVYGTLCETAIDAYFLLKGNLEWRGVTGLLAPYAYGSAPIEQVLISNGYLLTLHAVFLQKMMCQPTETTHILSVLFQMFSTFKPSDPSEPKLILLFGLAIIISQNRGDSSAPLRALTGYLLSITTDRNSGFLSTIGLKKITSPSAGMKLCCLALCSGIHRLTNTVGPALSSFEQAQTDKQFNSVLGHVFTLREQVMNCGSFSQLVLAVYSAAAQIYGKSYFVF